MTPPLIFILKLLSDIAKENQTGPVRCQGCYRDTGILRHGYYFRYLFDSEEMHRIQRYRCCNPDCDCVTFSILPHPFLRYIRLPFCFLLKLLSAHENEGENLSSLARQTGMSRPRVKRAMPLARKIARWLERIALWPEGGRPCFKPQERWTDFIRAFSWSFFPGRYPGPENHTN